MRDLQDPAPQQQEEKRHVTVQLGDEVVAGHGRLVPGQEAAQGVKGGEPEAAEQVGSHDDFEDKPREVFIKFRRFPDCVSNKDMELTPKLRFSPI